MYMVDKSIQNIYMFEEIPRKVSLSGNLSQFKKIFEIIFLTIFPIYLW